MPHHVMKSLRIHMKKSVNRGWVLEPTFRQVDLSSSIHKLSFLDISPSLLCWIQCYPQERMHRVVINGSQSEFIPVTSGVPRVFILASLLFLV